MPSKETFNIPVIGAFVHKYLALGGISVDPFARNCRWATFTNDLNPETEAEYHMDALKFVRMLDEQMVPVRCTLFDPPYSLRQIKECYNGIGIDKVPHEITQTRWNPIKDIITEMTEVGGCVLSFGWNSCGFGKTRGFEIAEILMVCHGGNHYDTICVVEKKVA